MSNTLQTAVEITQGDDHLDIWVDANNNGIRDDDDVNIFVTKNGSLYTESPNFRGQLDTLLKDRVRELGVALLNAPHDQQLQSTLCAMALEMVVKAIQPAQEEAVAEAPTQTWQ